MTDATESGGADRAAEVTVEDRLTAGTDAHAADPDENPEDHVGDEIPDPWADDNQTDWPNHPEMEV